MKWLKKEILSALPAVIYFFIAFTVFNLTFGWLLQEAGSRLMTWPRIIISSIIIGKIMIVAGAMPFLNKFPDKPLIYNTVWKTGIYSFFGFVFIVIERLGPYFFKYKGSDAWHRMVTEVSWPRLIVAEVWLIILFLCFVLSRELINSVGKDKLRRIFFG